MFLFQTQHDFANGGKKIEHAKYMTILNSASTLEDQIPSDIMRNSSCYIDAYKDELSLPFT